jgi:hypothetical protein
VLPTLGLVLALVVAACGSSLSDQEVLRANGASSAAVTDSVETTVEGPNVAIAPVDPSSPTTSTPAPGTRPGGASTP